MSLDASPIDGLDVPVGRREARAVLLRAVAADHGFGSGMKLFELIAAAAHYGLRTEDERAEAIDAPLADDS
jgi:hypothetical protein